MNYQETYDTIGNVDIYVLDQILKNRYLPSESILDAGCGEGRNLKWFYQNDYTIFGIDQNEERLGIAQHNYPKMTHNFQVGVLDNLPFGENSFDHIICCAVLHFAQSEKHFTEMFAELVRTLKQRGTLLIRMASNIGLDGKAPLVRDNKTQVQGYYYLTRERITSLLKKHPLVLLEPIKTTNVQDMRAMTTLVFRKM